MELEYQGCITSGILVQLTNALNLIPFYMEHYTLHPPLESKNMLVRYRPAALCRRVKELRAHNLQHGG